MQTHTKTLAELFELDPASDELWRADELAAVFGHQMDSPLSSDLKVNVDLMHGSRIPHTFGELLNNSQPQLPLLQAVKQFAKSCGSAGDRLLPRQVAAVLYICSIAAALVRCGTRITELDNQSLRKKFKWAAERDWVRSECRDLLNRAVDILET